MSKKHGKPQSFLAYVKWIKLDDAMEDEAIIDIVSLSRRGSSYIYNGEKFDRSYPMMRSKCYSESGSHLLVERLSRIYGAGGISPPPDWAGCSPVVAERARERYDRYTAYEGTHIEIRHTASGKAFIIGTDYSVDDVIEMVRFGMTPTEITESFPDLDETKIKAAREFKSAQLRLLSPEYNDKEDHT